MSIGDPTSYSVVLPTIGLAALEREALSLSATLEADGTPAQASLVRSAFMRLLQELEAIALKTATFAEKSIKSHEIDSRVRPHGGTSPLNHFIGVSHPLPAVEGSVGINYEPDLYANVPWWWTNEEGYSGNLGRKFIGAFGGGGGWTKPDPSQFREHPLLRIGKGPGTGKGTIRHPIPARRFVEDGSQEAEVAWHAEIRAAKARFMRECVRANVASQQIVTQRRIKAAPRRRRSP